MIMKPTHSRFALLMAVLAAAGVHMLTERSTCLWAAPQAQKFEDLVQLNFGHYVVSGIGVKEKGGFTVVPVETGKTQTRVAVSFALKEEDNRPISDFQVVALDAAGNRHEAKDHNEASAGGNGLTVITLVSKFDLTSDKISALVLQCRTGK